MSKEQFFDKLLQIYRQSFNVKENFKIGDNVYDAYGYCNITNAKYVLVKKAELWRALCFEHILFCKEDELKEERVDAFLEDTVKKIESEMVRKGEKYPEKNHMYSYITCVFICENGFTKEAAKKLKKAKFFKDYMFSIRGYTEMRLLAIDLSTNKIIGNNAARDLIKDYKKFL